jgi:hypothetical protein
MTIFANYDMRFTIENNKNAIGSDAILVWTKLIRLLYIVIRKSFVNYSTLWYTA